MKALLAVVVGHTWRSPGAFSPTLDQHEHAFNCALAARIAAADLGRIGVFYRDGHGVAGAYAAAKAWGQRPGVSFGVLELHFNSAANVDATGTETLYRQPDSKPFAQAVQQGMVAALGLRDRGAKLPWQNRGDASLTALPGVPSIIVEPFFGSNPADCDRARARTLALAFNLANFSLGWLSERSK